VNKREGKCEHELQENSCESNCAELPPRARYLLACRAFSALLTWDRAATMSSPAKFVFPSSSIFWAACANA